MEIYKWIYFKKIGLLKALFILNQYMMSSIYIYLKIVYNYIIIGKKEESKKIFDNH